MGGVDLEAIRERDQLEKRLEAEKAQNNACKEMEELELMAKKESDFQLGFAGMKAHAQVLEDYKGNFLDASLDIEIHFCSC